MRLNEETVGGGGVTSRSRPLLYFTLGAAKSFIWQESQTNGNYAGIINVTAPKLLSGQTDYQAITKENATGWQISPSSYSSIKTRCIKCLGYVRHEKPKACFFSGPLNSWSLFIKRTQRTGGKTESLSSIIFNLHETKIDISCSITLQQAFLLLSYEFNAYVNRSGSNLRVADLVRINKVFI